MKEAERIFARGASALVRRVSEEEKIKFPHAELVREEFSNKKDIAQIVFYWHKIASLLFPDHFIKVIATTASPNCGTGGEFEVEPSLPIIYKMPALNSLYSRIAKVSSDHAAYTTHMGFQTQDALGLRAGGKKFECSCPACRRHHKKHGLINRLRGYFLSAKLEKAGICVPTDDPTDVCRSDGKLVFFEIDWVDPQRVKEYVAENKNLLPFTKRRVLNLTRHLDQLHRLPEEDG